MTSLSKPELPAARTGRVYHAVSILLLTIVVGALTGFSEGSILWVRRSLGAVTFTSRHVIWMTTVSYALVYSTFGALLGLAALAVPRIVSRRSVASVLAASVLFMLLLPLGWLSRYAIVLIGLGVSFRVWQTWDRRSVLWARLTFRFSVFATAVIALTLAWSLIHPFWQGRGDSPGGAVNVVILVWDTVRAESLSLYGYGRPTTPHLARIARSGTRFENAISTSPWTLPSHASMFTGEYPRELSAHWFVALNSQPATLAEWCREGGWHTGGFVANHRYTGYDSGLGRGFEHYEDYFVSLNQALITSNLIQTPTGAGTVRGIMDGSLSKVLGAIRLLDFYPRVNRLSQRKHASAVNQQFLDWIDGLNGEPFFAFLNYFDAHQEYWAPEDVIARFTSGDVSLTDSYDAAIAYLDEQTGALFDALGERGLLDNTLLVITADHGELFGEHGQTGHASNLYRDVLRVPLVMHLPGSVPAGRTIGGIVSLRDLAATVATLASTRPHPFPGESLTRFFAPDGDTADSGWALAEVRPGRSHPADVPLSRGAMVSLTARGYHYVLNGDGQEELYDYRSNAMMPVNLAAAPDSAVDSILFDTHRFLRAEITARPSRYDGWATRDSLILRR